MNLQERYFSLRDQIIDYRFRNLNEEQRNAVKTINGQVLILAGAGSGKTTVIVNRINNMISFGDSYGKEYKVDFLTEDIIQNMENYLKEECQLDENTLEILGKQRISPWSILAITFTNKAAKEMKERISKSVGVEAEKIWISTFHSTCVRILRNDIERLGYKSDFTIYDSYDQKSLVKQCMKELQIDEKDISDNEIIRAIGSAKDDLISSEEFKHTYQGDYRKNKIAEAYVLYQKKLKLNNAVDFDDLIFKTVDLFKNHPDVLEHYQNKFKYVLVDEYQDTNRAQYVFIKMLTDKYKNICVVGDEDQCIYEWRGANISNILNFEKTYPDAKLIKLEKNYRSKGNILEAANSIIVNNIQRKDKVLRSTKDAGEKIIVYRADNENHETEYIINKIGNLIQKENLEYKDFAILYRTNSQSRNFEDYLVRRGIPYRIVGGLKFYDRKEIKDILSYLKVLSNPQDNVALMRIINTPKRNIGDTTIDKLLKIGNDYGLSLYDVILDINNIGALSSRTTASINKFAELLVELNESKEILSVSDLILEIYEKTGYKAQYKKSKNPEDESRVENLEELYNGAVAFEEMNEDKSLSAFLEQTSLISDIDNYDEDNNAVVLMTVHSSKGLEFPVVFLSGMENGVFPGQSSFNMRSEMEESRRLCYVGITRSKDRLYLTSSCSRKIFGKTSFNMESIFVKEIDTKFIDREGENSIYLSQKSESNSKRKISEFDRGLERLGKMFEDKAKTSKSFEEAKMGDKVKHTIFGTGTIVNLTKSPGNNKATIAFENNGVKTLILEKSPLEII